MTYQLIPQSQIIYQIVDSQWCQVWVSRSYDMVYQQIMDRYASIQDVAAQIRYSSDVVRISVQMRYYSA